MVKLYVEGGGETSQLKADCRKGFRLFIESSGLRNQPRIVACGSRRDAYDSYCTAIANGEKAMLLVDSEADVAEEFQADVQKENWNPWGHLKQREGDSWEKPVGAVDTDCHLMVQCMETWFIAEPQVLKSFFGQGFRENALPATNRPIEQVAKQQVYEALKKATRDSKKGPYGKGNHSFKILKAIPANKVEAASPWAKRFIDALKQKMDQ